MDHFDCASWADFVRGTVAPDQESLMERHLTEGCTACGQLAELFGRVYRESREEVPVPEDLVRAARAVFPAPAGAALPNWLLNPLLSVRLVFCSLTEPALEGARSAAEAMVQAVYHAGDLAIDLQIDREPESPEIALIGQVLNRLDSGKPLSSAPVVLVAGNRVLGSAQSNRFGEFCLAGRIQPGLKLCMQVKPHGERVEIPLAKLIAGVT